MTLERRAGLAETVFLISHFELAGTTQAVVAAEFSEPLPVPRIVAGLHSLFRSQPMLRARLAGTAPNWRFTFDTSFDDVEIRTRESGQESFAEIFATECDNILDQADGPMWRALLVTNGGFVVAIIVAYAHAIGDGVSGISFLRQLLAGPDRVDSYPIGPAMEDIMPVPAEPPAAGEGGSHLLEPTGEWPFDDVTEVCRRHTNVLLGYLDSGNLDSLLRRCRTAQVSVEAFFVSAILAVLARRVPAALSVPVICAFDVRSELHPPVPAAEIGMYMKDLRLFDPKWAEQEDIWIRARRIRRQVVAQRKWVVGHPEPNTPTEVYDQIRLAADYPLKSFLFGFSIANMGRQSAMPGLRSLYLNTTDRIGIMGFQVVLTELNGALFLTFVHVDPLVASSTIAAIRDDVIEIACSTGRPAD
jgi:hypothetical protein